MMNLLTPDPDASSVATGHVPVTESQARSALDAILSSERLKKSPQLQRLLRFLVDETLAGHGDRLKEYVIGVEIFGRPASYDPRLDSLVRVEVRRLRAVLEVYYRNEGTHDPVIIQLHKGSYVPCFLLANDSPVQIASETRSGSEKQLAPRSTWMRATIRPRTLGFVVVTIALLVLATILTISRMYARRAPMLTERDSIVVADFVNSTDDPVFDGALKQGLTLELEQSPFLNLVPDRRVAQVLKLMGRSPAERLTQDLAREVCQRTESKATVTGSISRLGDQYVVNIAAVDCVAGYSFARVQQQAASKEQVLNALSTATNAMRGKLGESLSSIHNFGAPLEEATTPSLDALQAYSLGKQTARDRGSPADIPFYLRAIELDPKFASAHAALGVSYVNLGQPSLGAEHLKRAYDLSDRVSERERYRISAYYFHAGTGQLEKAIETYELWKRSYPRDFAPYINLGLAHDWLGQYDKAVEETNGALRVDPTNVLTYTNLAAFYIKLGRDDDAKAILDQALARNFASKFLRQNLYMLAFRRQDVGAMQKLLADATGSPASEDPLLAQQSDTEAYYGRLKQARAFSRRAVESATRAGNKEAAAGWLVNVALREAEFGNHEAARKAVADALHLSNGRDVTVLAALALARAGETRRAEALLRSLARDYPLNTVVTVYWLPTIRAAIELSNGNALRAVDVLQSTSPYELGSPPPMGLATLYPVYLRGEAYLLAHQPANAAAEAQKILDHPGLVLNFPLHALAHLQSARAKAMANDLPSSRRAYDDLFVLWKDADTDLALLQRARAERRNLK